MKLFNGFYGMMITTPSMTPISDLVINTNTSNFKYSPKEDITTFELSKMLHLFSVLISQSFTAGYVLWDVEGFIKENKLERHFEEVIK